MRLSTLHASRYLISYKIAKIPRVRALLAEDATSKYPWSGFHVVAVGLGPRRTRPVDASRADGALKRPICLMLMIRELTAY